MKRVKFTEDFGVKRIGDVCDYDGQLASQLVNHDQVAEFTSDDLTPVDPDREYLMPVVKDKSEAVVEETAADDKSVTDSETGEEDDMIIKPPVEEEKVAENEAAAAEPAKPAEAKATSIKAKAEDSAKK